MSNFLTVNGKGGMVMKKSFFYFALSLLTIAAGCHREEVGTTESANDVMEIYASVETVADLSTRTYLEGTEVLWSEGDQIAVCLGNATVNRFNVKSGSEGSTTAVFEKDETYNGEVRDVQLSNNIAWYPFCEFSCASRDSGYMLFVAFPSAQKYAPDSFPEGAFPMVAVTKDVAQQEYSFRNVCGAIMLQLKGSGSIRSVSITGNSSEILAGIASVSAAYGTDPSVELLEDECTTVTLDCGEDGVALDTDVPTSFIIALPPVPFEKGFVITVTDTRGGSKNYVTAKPNPIIRSKIRRMPVLEYNGRMPQEGDYIDEYGINHGQGVEVGGIVWAPVNCGYKAPVADDKGYPKGKLYQWGRRYGHGYSSDATKPSLMDGGVPLLYGNDQKYADIFYKGIYKYDYDWISPQEDRLWNAGSESDPVKTEYDPCPDGWRVPVKDELEVLVAANSTWEEELWGTGFDNGILFFPGKSCRNYDGTPYSLSWRYWSSTPYSEYESYSIDLDVDGTSMQSAYQACGFPVRCIKDDSEMVQVSGVTLNETSMTLLNTYSKQLSAVITPSDANHQYIYWFSSDENVASVSPQGLVSGRSPGTATITAVAGMQSADCNVVVKALPAMIDYVDEYGTNRGKGVEIDGVVWAPVNCGYHDTDFKYGKLYQWGRKYGQGYFDAGELCYMIEGPVSIEVGQSEEKQNCFITGRITASPDQDWMLYVDYQLWNCGTEEEPLKTKYDPCPEGWRVPTYNEMNDLLRNCSGFKQEYFSGLYGRWFSGSVSYPPLSKQIFLPAAGKISNICEFENRGDAGWYWTSQAKAKCAESLYYTDTWSPMMYSAQSRANGCSVRCVQDDSGSIPIEDISIATSPLNLYVGDSEMIPTEISPSDLENILVHWTSDDPAVATVKDGKVTAIAPGKTIITAAVGMKKATCEVIVDLWAKEGDYVDEYGINHGQGVDIDGIIWAPVNCGYHQTKFKYGKLYQWGRKYGQGYNGVKYDIEGWEDGTYSDGLVPRVLSGPVSLNEGQSESAENYFYSTDSNPFDWLSRSDDMLWNSGTEDNPKKADYDPCPDGWRIPTYAELESLGGHKSSTAIENGLYGCWFSDSQDSSASVSRVFLPVAGCRSTNGIAKDRCCDGYYWSSKTWRNTTYILYYGYALHFTDSYTQMFDFERSYGCSVRCVQE